MLSTCIPFFSDWLSSAARLTAKFYVTCVLNMTRRLVICVCLLLLYFSYSISAPINCQYSITYNVLMTDTFKVYVSDFDASQR
jgi:hypothetical protein